MRNYYAVQYVIPQLFFLATAAGNFSVCFHTVCILVKIEKQNNKNIYLKDGFTARTLPCIFDYIYRIMGVAPCVYICVITVSLSLSRSVGSGPLPIINPQSCARSVRQLCIWAGQGEQKNRFGCAHMLRALPRLTAYTHTQTNTHVRSLPIRAL